MTAGSDTRPRRITFALYNSLLGGYCDRTSFFFCNFTTELRDTRWRLATWVRLMSEMRSRNIRSGPHQIDQAEWL